jgi:hypothetical protein
VAELRFFLMSCGDSLVRTRTRWINLVRALVRGEGFRIRSGAAESFSDRVEELELSADLRAQIEPVLDQDSRSLVWSPDGDRVFFVARRKGRGNLYEKEFGRRAERQLTDFAGRPGRLEFLWDTDGRFLYFAWREDFGDLWVMDVDQGQ